jgi:Rps23 Pro-64 3,4-dihydroxylase Tpa1-like proline 4-hydroxylase
MIKVYDDFLNLEQHQNVLNYCERASYIYGETDNDLTPPTGVTHDIPEGIMVHEVFRAKIKKIIPEGLSFYRMYINCFSPREIPYFHTDGSNGVTLLYYPQYDWKPDDGGETQIFVDDNIHGVVPISNRMLMFDARMLHRATTFRDRHRFTIAIKYEEK